MRMSKLVYGALISCTLLVAGLNPVPTQAAVDRILTDSPPMVTVGVPPNLMFILDDSGSMDWSYIPDSLHSSSPSQRTTKRVKSGTYNVQYYSPDVEYVLPVDHEGNPLPAPSFTNAWTDGYRAYRGFTSGRGNLPFRVNLSSSFRPTWRYPSDGTSGRYAGDAESAYYYVFDPNKSGCIGSNKPSNDNCYTKVTVSSTSGPGGTDERQNFANWYSYYRTRVFSSRAAIGRAFAVLPENFRYGWGRINNANDANRDGVTVNTIERGVRTWTGSHRKAFYDWLYSTEPTGNTPLRRSLNAAGKYYSNGGSNGPWSTTPGTSGGDLPECRQSYTILMTDGYYNGSFSGLGNVDNNNGPVINGPDGQTYQYTPADPFRDGASNSLADIAMYYWSRDLVSGIPNEVPTSARNPAFWQHMVTYTVGLGVHGNIDPETAFAAVETGTAISWPSSINTDARKIDDLLHAAVNGRGGFFSVDDPIGFANELTAMLRDIVKRAETATSTGTSSRRFRQGTMLHEASYNSDGWTGDVELLDPLDPAQPPTASAKVELDAMSWNTRNVFTHNPASGSGVLFNTSLPSAIQASLMVNVPSDSDWWSHGVSASDLIDYVRGDDSLAALGTGVFRHRDSRLGDIVNSELVFSGGGNQQWGEVDGYLDYLVKKNDPRDCDDDGYPSGSCPYQRPAVVFVGANDGMLHAFDAQTMKERFAYVPSTLHGRLHELADPDYEHAYFVDGQIAVGDAKINGSWGTFLVGTLGAGGRGIFALDVTRTDSFNASDVLWELTPDDLGGELGYTFSSPTITRLEDGRWVVIFGNGYNSDPGRNYLFVVDLEDGSVIEKLPLGSAPGSSELSNGLSSVTSLRDSETRSYVERVYAGDLYGTMWRVDFENSTAKLPAGMSNGLFTDPNKHAITAAPALAWHHTDGLMVYFGTGKLFEVGDKDDYSIQTFYGIRDLDARVNFADLSRNAVTSGGLDPDTGRPTRAIEPAGPTGSGGWYVNLKLDSDSPSGERSIYRPEIVFGLLRFQGIEGSDNPCEASERIRSYSLNPFTGSGEARETDRTPAGIISPEGMGPPDESDIEVPIDWQEDPAGGAGNTPPALPPQPTLSIGLEDSPRDWCFRETLNSARAVCIGRQAWREVEE